MSTMPRGTHEFEYHAPRCAQLKYLSTHSNQVGSWSWTKGQLAALQTICTAKEYMKLATKAS